jgi:hypothetical protein
MKKETRAERERRRYAAIRNYYGDEKLARKYRGYSDERILKEIGVRVPKSTPKLKPIPDEMTRAKKSRDLEKYRFAAIEVGLEPIDAIRLKKVSRKKIVTTKEYRDVMARSDRGNASTQERIDLWAKWSKTKSMPPELVQMAREVNATTILEGTAKRTRLGKSDKYGYGVIYYSFMNLEEPDSVRERYLPNYRDLNISGMFVRRKK